MTIKYSCFISYTHVAQSSAVKHVTNFVEGLKDELCLLRKEEVFFDTHSLKGGALLDDSIGRSICKSACMILLFTPFYFAEEHIFCARELKAMWDLEAERLKLLPNGDNGLIIPVILRGKDEFPETLRRRRIFHDFTSIHVNETKPLKRKFAKQIHEIAEYINARCKELDGVKHKLSRDCDEFIFPTENEAKKFIQTEIRGKIVGNPVPFIRKRKRKD